MMYCPNCKQEFNAKFCPECGTRLIETPQPGRINMNFGDGNAIKDFQLNDSHNIDNSVTNTTYDSRVINTSNVSHIVERQKTSEELKAEAKSQFAQYCRDAFQDGIITEHKSNFLQSKQLELGLSDDDAKCFIDQQRNAASHKSTTLNTSAVIVLNKIGKLMDENNTRMLSAQIPRLKTLASLYDIDEVQYLYHLVMAATRPDELINEYQRIDTDKYWKTYWVYIAYLKNKELEKAESAIRELGKFNKCTEDNSMLLTAIGMYNDFGAKEACEYTDAIIPEMCSNVLRDFIHAIFTVISPERANEVGTNKERCRFFIENIINLGGPGTEETEYITPENAEQCYGIGIEHYNKEEYSESVKWFKKAAEQGYALALNILGDCYLYARGVIQDYNEAFRLYKEAAEQGNAEAQYNLGKCFEESIGVKQDYANAVKWYKKAAEQGCSCAKEVLFRLDEEKRKAEEKRRQEAEEIERRKIQEDAEVHYNKGLEYYNKKEYSESVKWFKKAAEQGNAKAQFKLGYCYQYEKGVIEDINEAVKWYNKAAEQGYAEAQNGLGDYYFWDSTTRDYAKAVKWYKKAAEQGIARAQASLGYCYATGPDAVKNDSEAFKWYKKAAEQGDMVALNNIAHYYKEAAEQGDADAQYNFGKCYEFGYGHGIKKDINEAIKWYKKAAEQECAEAQEALVRLEKVKRRAERRAEKRKQETEKKARHKIQEEADANYNKGLEYYNKKEYIEAVKWFNKAAEQGSLMAHTYLGIYYSAIQDYVNAVEHYKKAAEKGETSALINLGKCYYNGHGVERNYSEAFKLFSKAAEMGFDEAERLLGECYLHGNGAVKDIGMAIKCYTGPSERGDVLAQSSLGICFYLRQNYSDAAKWFQKAAEYGELAALFNLGNCYRLGQGVHVDMAQAFKLYKKSAEGGYGPAQTNLGYCYCKGVGTSQNYIEGINWYRKAAEQGDAGGQVNLGHYYFYVKEAQDYIEAAKWYRLAAEQGNADAQCHLAECYNKGFGVSKDFDKARQWYKRAIEQGHKDAEWRLKLVGVEYEPVFSEKEKKGVAEQQNKSTSIFQKIKNVIDKLP